MTRISNLTLASLDLLTQLQSDPTRTPTELQPNSNPTPYLDMLALNLNSLDLITLPLPTLYGHARKSFPMSALNYAQSCALSRALRGSARPRVEEFIKMSVKHGPRNSLSKLLSKTLYLNI